MQRHCVGSLVYYTFDSLQDRGLVVHGVSTRHGGVSAGPFATLNLSASTADDGANVATNTERWHRALGLDRSATVDAGQAQADQVALVGARERGKRIPRVDALLTNEANVHLMLRYADCVPIVYFDPVSRAIGLAHAGWRGTVAGIATKAAQAMFAAFGTRPHDLVACIGPSIGPCCYRVGRDVIAQVQSSLDGADSLLVSQPGGSIHLDLWRANEEQLRQAGIKQIEVAGICTAHHTDDFYSWRAENARTGRFGVIVSLVR